MRSTDRPRDYRELRAFFRRRLVPLARRLRKRGVSLFPMGPDQGAESWYVPYPADTPPLVEFDLDTAQAELEGLWEEQGLADLAELAAPLLELARRLERKELIEEAEIPDFIYAMH